MVPAIIQRRAHRQATSWHPHWAHDGALGRVARAASRAGLEARAAGASGEASREELSSGYAAEPLGFLGNRGWVGGRVGGAGWRRVHARGASRRSEERLTGGALCASLRALPATPPVHPGEGRRWWLARIAQLVEQGIENPRVGGSIPSPRTARTRASAGNKPDRRTELGAMFPTGTDVSHVRCPTGVPASAEGRRATGRARAERRAAGSPSRSSARRSGAPRSCASSRSAKRTSIRPRTTRAAPPKPRRGLRRSRRGASACGRIGRTARSRRRVERAERRTQCGATRRGSRAATHREVRRRRARARSRSSSASKRNSTPS